MILEREPHMESWLLEQIQASFGTGVRADGLHASDLQVPRQRYWAEVEPRLGSVVDVQYWLAGLGHEQAFTRVTGLDHGEARQWEGVWYTPDFALNIPADLKTRRRNLAKAGEEAEVYAHYLERLRMYAAMQDRPVARLFVFSLVEKQANAEGSTQPELACYRVEWTEAELEATRDWLRVRRDGLEEALARHDPSTLPLCAAWMCGKRTGEQLTGPYCETCQREFQTVWGAEKHCASSTGRDRVTGEPHLMRPAVVQWRYQARCRWHEVCQPWMDDPQRGGGDA